MKRDYEIACVMRLDSNEEVLRDNIEQVRAWIEAGEEGKVTRIDRWGRRKLAYEVDRQREGYYVFFYAQVEPNAMHELDQNLKLASFVLRYLVVRADEVTAAPNS